MIFPWFFDGDLTLIFFDNLFLSEFLFNLCLNFEIFAHFFVRCCYRPKIASLNICIYTHLFSSKF